MIHERKYISGKKYFPSFAYMFVVGTGKEKFARTHVVYYKLGRCLLLIFEGSRADVNPIIKELSRIDP